jgi:hypothetical protein
MLLSSRHWRYGCGRGIPKAINDKQGNPHHEIETMKGGPYPVKGYFASIMVPVDGVWKERMTCYNKATAPETK